jgi:hypothetical protein
VIERHKERYFRAVDEAAAEAQAGRLEALARFPKVAAQIVREMTEEVKAEARRHGYDLAAASLKELERRTASRIPGAKKPPSN